MGWTRTSDASPELVTPASIPICPQLGADVKVQVRAAASPRLNLRMLCRCGQLTASCACRAGWIIRPRVCQGKAAFPQTSCLPLPLAASHGNQLGKTSGAMGEKAAQRWNGARFSNADQSHVPPSVPAMRPGWTSSPKGNSLDPFSTVLIKHRADSQCGRRAEFVPPPSDAQCADRKARVEVRDGCGNGLCMCTTCRIK